MKQHFSLHGDKWIPTKQIDSMWEFVKAVSLSLFCELLLFYRKRFDEGFVVNPVI